MKPSKPTKIEEPSENRKNNEEKGIAMKTTQARRELFAVGKALFVAAILGLIGLGSAKAAPVYYMTWDNGPTNGSPNPYVLGPGEILPAGVSNERLGVNSLVVAPTGSIQGGLALDNRGAWTENGYRFTESEAGGLTGTFTFETVFYLVATNNRNGEVHYSRGLIYDNASAANNRGIKVRLDDDGSHLFNVVYDIDPLGGGGGSFSLSTSNVVALSNWYHLAVVHDASGAHVYLNNALIASNPTPIGSRTVIGTNNWFEVGQIYGNGNQYLGGFLDAWAISDTALAPGTFAIPEPGAFAMLTFAGALVVVARAVRNRNSPARGN